MVRSLTTALFVLILAPAAPAQPPSADEVLETLGLPGSAKQKVLAGEFAQVDLPSSSERDLTVGLAFLVDASSPDFDRELIRTRLLSQMKPTMAYGRLDGDASATDFAALELTAEEKRLFLAAKPGDQLNLSAAEIATLRALDGDESRVDATLRELLLARYRAYRSGGLAGIEGYQRASGKSDASGDLRRANDTSHLLRRYEPAVYRFLQNIPENPPQDLDELFYWSHFEAHGETTIVLGHSFSARDGDAFAVVQRAYYVSRGYNVEQAIASFFPVQRKTKPATGNETLVAYTNHTSTDQVAGFGGTAKRKIGQRVMAAQLEELLEKLRDSASAK